jgi:glycosyltransferase involved in cell wall biosynthesis
LSTSNEATSPLVSIGLPTFNRADLLGRAIDSLLAQSYRNIEIVISDNASTDATQLLCETYAKRDARVRYLRQAVNLGPSPNFLATLTLARGEYFMWLSDDDWLDPDYLAHCAGWLVEHDDYALVAGVSRGYRAGKFDREFAATNLEQASGVARVLQYYAGVADNSIFYGVMRRADAIESPMRNLMGADWLFVAGLAFRGKVKTVPEVRVHRELGGTSAGLVRIAKVLKLPMYQVMFRFLFLATMACDDIIHNHRVYAGMQWPARVMFAARTFLCFLMFKSVKENARYFTAMLLRKLLGDERYLQLRRKWAKS